jgi:phosphoribosylformimino-5-aminoimidazole carboxamide ribotide isomerase
MCYCTNALIRYNEWEMASSFDLLAAIDLVAGRVVRLVQGDFGRETRFSDDPIAVANRFVAAGARWLHVVDLDGARVGETRQLPVIGAIVAAAGDRARVEIAGGLRSDEAVAAAFRAGASRVVLGTAAIRDPAFAGSAVATYGAARVTVALDVRDGRAVGEGWREGAPSRDVGDAIVELADSGVTTFEVTAIERDGLRTGPDLDLLRSLVAPSRAVIASGGITSMTDVIAVRELGCAGVILGRALYEGDVTLEDVLAEVRR